MSGRGTLFLITGPSGSGKDSLINWLRPHFERDSAMMFVRRVITRTDGGNEDHDTMTDHEFARARDANAFCVTWEAHGLQYGIPTPVLAHTQKGGHAMMNGSRRALTSIASVFPQLHVINLDVAPEVLVERLSARGRESAEEISTRLARSAGVFPTGIMVTHIDNSGPLHHAGRSTLDVIAARIALNDPSTVGGG